MQGTPAQPQADPKGNGGPMSHSLPCCPLVTFNQFASLDEETPREADQEDSCGVNLFPIGQPPQDTPGFPRFLVNAQSF